MNALNQALARLRRPDLGWSAAYLVVSRGSALAAVPLVLHEFGKETYASWVIASTVLMSYALIDFGLGAALVRYVAVGTANESTALVRDSIERAVLGYAAVSLAVALPLFIFAPHLADGFGAASPEGTDDFAKLLRYAAGTFVLNTLGFVGSAAQKGAGRIAEAFRAQTLAAATYLPFLVIALALGAGVHSLGSAWLVASGTQLILLGPATWAQVRSPRNQGGTVSFGEMLSLGGRWQVSSWADYATFQLPRLVSGVSLSSDAVVAIDVAIRFGQAITAPLLAFLPLVLPRATHIWAQEGKDALTGRLTRWYVPMALITIVGVAAAVPLAPPAIATWIGASVADVDVVVTSLVLVGICCHASTGILTSAALAAGNVNLVLRYKSRQLLVGLLVFPAAFAGTRFVAAALSAALTVPALHFNHSAARYFGMPALSSFARPRWVVAALAIAVAPPAFAVASTSSSLPPWGVLLLTATASALGALAALAVVRKNAGHPGSSPTIDNANAYREDAAAD